MTIKFAINKLIVGGMRDLKEFGFHNVNVNNILTDKVYGSFFNKLLEEMDDKLPKSPYFSENKTVILQYKSAIKILKRKIQNNGIN